MRDTKKLAFELPSLFDFGSCGGNVCQEGSGDWNVCHHGKIHYNDCSNGGIKPII